MLGEVTNSQNSSFNQGLTLLIQQHAFYISQKNDNKSPEVCWDMAKRWFATLIQGAAEKRRDPDYYNNSEDAKMNSSFFPIHEYDSRELGIKVELGDLILSNGQKITPPMPTHIEYEAKELLNYV